MKTAAQILEERFEPNVFSLKKALGLKDDSYLIVDPAYKRILFAMQIYAKQVAQQALQDASDNLHDCHSSLSAWESNKKDILNTEIKLP